MKKLKLILVMVLVLIIPFGFIGCNRHIFDTNQTYNYAIIEINGKRVLHEISHWADSESESAMIRTKCCDNEIWFSVNNGELYKNKPSSSYYDCECEE